MFDFTTIKAALIEKVGFSQNPDGAAIQLPASLIGKTYSVNDMHPLLTPKALECLAPDFEGMTLTGTRAENFAAELRRYLDLSLQKMLADWSNSKLQNFSGRSLIEQVRLFRPNSSDGQEIETQGNRFVGLEIVNSDSLFLANTFQRIGLQFTQAQTIRIYLFESGEKEPIQFQDCVYTQPGYVQWFTLNWKVVGTGKYLIAYDESAIVGRAIDAAEYLDHMGSGIVWPCGKHYSACGFSSAKTTIAGGIGEMEVEATFSVTNGDVSDSFDPNANSYTTSESYGLNLEMYVECDYSSLITDRADSFAYAWALGTACQLMRKIAYNPNVRINSNERKGEELRQFILYELDGASGAEGKTGLVKEYNAALKAIMFDQTSIDEICLPCARRSGTSKFKVIG